MSINYAQEEERDKKGINKFALFNIIIGIPALAFLIFFLLKGLLADYLIIVYIGIAIISLGISYSLFKLFNK